MLDFYTSYIYAAKSSVSNQIDDLIRLKLIHLNTSVNPTELNSNSILIHLEGGSRPIVIRSRGHVNTGSD